jgi:hypothetical protein
MRNQIIIGVVIILLVALGLLLSDFPGVPDVLLDVGLLILVGAALFLSGWIRSTMFH